ncbi:hypothetical protein [Candidatus Amarolinea aalborgensis]|uniref:hypothetical protein n=1 Tax=Candidatus Amarolinea aalborgensis TaxID=2249329 RepID=UPI003BF97387
MRALHFECTTRTIRQIWKSAWTWHLPIEFVELTPRLLRSLGQKYLPGLGDGIMELTHQLNTHLKRLQFVRHRLTLELQPASHRTSSHRQIPEPAHFRTKWSSGPEANQLRLRRAIP